MPPWNKGKTYRTADRTNLQGGHSAGERIGPGELVEYAGRNRHGHHKWYWLCYRCGSVQGPSVYNHIRRSKKCFSCSLVREDNPNWNGYQQLAGSYLASVRAGAKRRKLEYSVSPEYLWDIWVTQKGRCVYSGVQLTHGVDASIDRKDNLCGYIEGNVQWVHKDVNRMKTDFPQEYFVEMCCKIADTALISDFVRG